MAETMWSSTLEAGISSIAQVKPHVLSCFDDKEEALNAMLACDEVLTNIAMYSGATIVDVTIERDGTRVSVTFSDDGTPFDPVSYESIERDFEDWDIGGMGIKFVKQICSELDYDYSEGRNILTLCL